MPTFEEPASPSVVSSASTLAAIRFSFSSHGAREEVGYIKQKHCVIKVKSGSIKML